MTRAPHPMLDLAAWDAVSAPSGPLVIADGNSVTVNCYGGGQSQPPAMLVIKDGPMGSARERTFARVPRTVKHVAVMTGHGYISMDAMRFMADTEITWSVIDPGGRVPRTLSVSGGWVNPHYMRQQALCSAGMPYARVGVQIMRHLITEKIEGQAHNVEYVLGLADVAKEIRAMVPRVVAARSVETIMGHEGSAADTYWNAWRELPIVWHRPAPAQPNWLRFPSRRTLRRQWESNRGATDPVNAMLNFGYHCAETQCTLACYAHALSPGIGVGHATRDDTRRESFALDLIEIMRPRVDAAILGILAEPLNSKWFAADREGIVSLRAPLTHRIYRDVAQQASAVTTALFTVTKLLDGAKRRKR
jgi:CRISPR-associated endonuclease Cas1